MSISVEGSDPNQFTKALERYRAARSPFILSRITAATTLPYALCGIVAGYLAPSKEQFSALVFVPPAVRNPYGCDIVQHGTYPTLVFNLNNPFARPTYVPITLQELDTPNAYASRVMAYMHLSITTNELAANIKQIIDRRARELAVAN